jgi:hypothetical protein
MKFLQIIALTGISGLAVAGATGVIVAIDSLGANAATATSAAPAAPNSDCGIFVPESESLAAATRVFLDENDARTALREGDFIAFIGDAFRLGYAEADYQKLLDESKACATATEVPEPTFS